MKASQRMLNVLIVICLILGVTAAVSVGAAALDSEDTADTGATAYTAATPEITSLVCDENGINITWDPVDGAAAYRVYYKTSDGNWKRFANDVKGLTKLDSGVVYGREEAYTVRALDSSGNLISDYKHDGWTVSYGVDTPQITSLVSDENGINISWDPVEGVSTYRVYYKTSDGNWKRFANDIKGTTKLDTGVSYGREEGYTVRAINKKGEVMSGYKSAGWKTTYGTETPQITSLTSDESGIHIKWNKVAGASTYRVYYRPSTGGWKRFNGDITGTTKLDTGVSYGREEAYTVRAINKKGEVMSGYKSDGWKITYGVDTPQITSLTSDENGINIKWSKVAGASTYRVYYRPSTGGWKRFNGDITGTTKLDTGVSYGREEAYTVRAINKKGEVMSGFKSDGWKITYGVETPQITSLTSDANGINIKWNKVTGASTYRVYYKDVNGSWQRLGSDIKGTSVTDSDVQYGKAETYTIRAVNSKGSTISGYKSSGWTATYTYQGGGSSGSATLSFSVRHINLPAGSTFKTEAFSDGGTFKTVNWSSSDTSVATVSGSGLKATITAKKKGKTDITVTTKSGAKAVCTVDVTSTKTSDSLKNQINSLPLYPVKTGYVALDNKVESIFKSIFKSGYTTYDKLKAIYDYEIEHFSYEYIGLTQKQYQDFYNNSKNSEPESYYDSMLAARAYATLMNNKGVCYNYAAVFTVMMRAVGLECFSFEGTSTYADGHWDVHTWNNILINGRWLLFDAQVDDNIYNKLGYMLYDRFGLTASDSTVTENYKYETSDRLQDARYFNYFD